MFAKIRFLKFRKVPTLLPGCMLAIACFPLLTLAADPPEPLALSRLKQAETTIQAISQSDRHLILLGEDGQRLVVEAGPAVSNFDAVRPGDRVVVSYYDGIVAEVKPKGAGVPPTQATTKSASTPPGSRPAGAVGTSVATTVRVDAVDPATHTITFKRSDGVSRKLAVESAEAQRFIGQLKPGDEVQVTYREATAVSIEPARG